MDVNSILLSQRLFFNSNQTKDVDFRVAQLLKLKSLIQENETEWYEAIYDDFGKSRIDTFLTEFSQLYHEIDTCVKSLRSWSKPKKVRMDLKNFPAKSYIIPEPLGVVLVIGAWNYPYQLSLIPCVSALAAGNTVVLKPSEIPSRTSDMMAKLINDHFPEDYFCAVEGGVEETTTLLEYAFDKIFFTGSTHVGRIVYKAAAKHLTPVTLELGGKSPTFVLADADIKMTAKRLVWAKFMNAGQTCIAPDYVLVHADVEDEFLEAIRHEIINNYDFANGLPENYTRIIDAKNLERLLPLVDKSKLFHGGLSDITERIIQPTVLRDVSFDDLVMQEEIFGPILPIISFNDLDDVILKVKSRPKPLSCYIYTLNNRAVKQLLHELSFGGGCINDSLMHITHPKLPFGGVGHSGMGNYHGRKGFDTFTHFKSILHKPFWFEAPLKYPPFGKRKIQFLEWFMK